MTSPATMIADPASNRSHAPWEKVIITGTVSGHVFVIDSFRYPPLRVFQNERIGTGNLDLQWRVSGVWLQLLETAASTARRKTRPDRRSGLVLRLAVERASRRWLVAAISRSQQGFEAGKNAVIGAIAAPAAVLNMISGREVIKTI